MILAMAAALAMLAQPAPASPAFISQTDAFAAFADETAGLPEAEQVRRFHDRFGASEPGFYELRGRSPAAFDAAIARSLKAFPQIRTRYTVAASTFAETFEEGQSRFRKTFPDYRLTMPVYLLHSLGEMDGGTRTLRGRPVAIFGADVIARIHDETTIGPFMDHEFFHLYHAQYFPDCEALWCSLWQEGLAVYVASRMNPGASDLQLALTYPVPLRPAVDRRLKDAICLTRAKFASTEKSDYEPFFFGAPSKGPFPPRFGYYVGFLLAQKIGAAMPISDMPKLRADQVEPLLEKALADYGPCPV